MRSLARSRLVAVLVFGAAGCLSTSGTWADGGRMSGPALDKQLAAFDPKAVAAARHYYSQPSLRAGMVAMTDNMAKAMMGIVAQQNPGLSPDQQQRVRRIVGEVTKERIDLILEMSMVSALQTFTTEELVAMDQFYTSAVGARIMAKMPQMSAKLPAMMQAIMPDFMNEIREKVRKDGGEVKL